MNEIEGFPEFPVAKPKHCYTWNELNELEISETPMLWDGFLPSSEIALLAGIGGYGKSTLVRQLAVAIARGDSHFLTRAIHAPNRRVIYVSCEDGKDKTTRIMRSLGMDSQEGLSFVFGSQLSLLQVQIEILGVMQKGPVDLIVIDSLGNLFDGEQNSNSDAQMFYKEFDRFAEQTLVLFLHHIRKNGHRDTPDQVNIQGAGAFVQRARAVLMLTGNKHGTERYLHMEKENDVSDTFKYEALVLNFDRDSKRYSSDGETKPSWELGQPANTEDEWNSLFLEEETELPTGTLVERMMAKYGIQRRAAMDRLKKSDLKKSRRGVYLRPGCFPTQSAESAIVQHVQKVQPEGSKRIKNQRESDTK